MNRALCKVSCSPHSCGGLGCGNSLSQCRDRVYSCARTVRFYSKLSDPQKIGHGALPPSPLSLPLSFKPVAALSSSLRFFRFGREDGSNSLQVGFQANGDHDNQVSLEAGKEPPSSSDEEVESTCMEASALKSVDMSNILSMAVAEAESSGDGADARVEVLRSAEQMSRPLIQNFAKLSSFWRKENSDREASKDSKSSKTDSTTIPIESCQFIPPSCGCQSCGSACCSESGFDAANMHVTPHSEIARNKEYFGTFLCRVPSTERKRIAQMAHLSNLAYRIPTIEEEKLFRHHHFRVVTSSFELKAIREAAGDANDSVTEEETTNIGDGVGNLEENDTNAQMEDEETMASLNPAAGYAMAATAASCNAQACDLLLSKSESNTSELREEVRGDCRDNKDAPEKCDATAKVGDSSSSQSNPWYLRTAANVLRATPGVSADPGTQPKPAPPPPVCPCEWFACENEATSTLVVVIQGTETLAAWQANLQFEPTQFEPESNSGVMVHRGIYEAAKRLYEEVLPCIRAHVELHKENARLQFTGHSLGGSLATLLSLMIGVRNEAPVSALLPVYTFGSPCIMCGGNHLLAQLGLPHSHIQSIVMHMDIVPRTFACDYPDHVAVVLKRVSGTFRNHTCLLQQRLIYAPMGEMVIMQPEEDQAPGHPLLPQGSGLYILRIPTQPGISQAKNENPLRPARELHSAERAFLNVPHPLEILSDRNAYGSEGTISRDHDCRNYLKALHRMRRNELKQRRRALREFRRQLWAPLLEGGDVAPSHFYGEPGKNACNSDRPSLGLEGQYRDIMKSKDNLKSAGKFSHFFQFKQKKSGPSSLN
ncbi:hypothetical protein M758_6G061700 [Ceratodon purpureus]|nr:hypothetical protein M758_6G061700 [Ceratodon purpureus]